MINTDLLSLLDNDGKLLYVLKIMGPLRFEEFINILNPFERLSVGSSKTSSSKDIRNKRLGYQKRHMMSRGTISKHLKYLKSPKINYIHQISEMNANTLRNVQKYDLTARGRGFINQLIKEDKNLVRPDLYGMIYHKITDFFLDRGLEKTLYLPKIITMIARIDQEKFFKLPQTDEMYYTLLFIFQNMLEFSINETNLSFFELKNFCETYKVSEKQIEANIEKVLEGDLGYYQLNWDSNYLFFQKEDLLGSIIFNLIENAIESEIIKQSLELENVLLFNEIAHNISEKLVTLKLIRPQLQLSMWGLIIGLLIIVSLERGLTRLDIVKYWPHLNTLLSYKKGVNISIKIFEPNTDYKKLYAIEQALEIINQIEKENEE